MALRKGLLTALLLSGVLAGGCGRSSDGKSSPTSPGSQTEAGSSPGTARPPQPPRPDPPPSSGTCVASQARWAIGKPASPELLERARVDAGAGLARFIRPDQPITLEFSGARLNLYLDRRDVVQSVICG
jgi:hypothetical protein